MKTASSPQSEAAAALVELLPTAAVLVPRPCSTHGATPAQLATAVTGSYVGATSADVAVVLAEGRLPDVGAGADPGLVSAADVLRPALEAASAALGAGVLSEVQEANGGPLFEDPASEVFELTDGAAILGWFAIRVRPNSSVSPRPFRGETISGKLGRINNVEMALTVEIGRTRMAVRDVLNLEPGGVIELDRSAGAPADVLLNGRLIAHGEVVVVDQDYAVRITKILDVADGGA